MEPQTNPSEHVELGAAANLRWRSLGWLALATVCGLVFVVMLWLDTGPEDLSPWPSTSPIAWLVTGASLVVGFIANQRLDRLAALAAAADRRPLAERRAATGKVFLLSYLVAAALAVVAFLYVLLAVQEDVELPVDLWLPERGHEAIFVVGMALMVFALLPLWVAAVSAGGYGTVRWPTEGSGGGKTRGRS